MCTLDLLHGMRHVAELADAGRLDDDTIRCVLLHDLLERLVKSPTSVQQMQPEFISVI